MRKNLLKHLKGLKSLSKYFSQTKLKMEPEPLKHIPKYGYLVPNEKRPNESLIENDHQWRQKFIFTWRKYLFIAVNFFVDFYKIFLETSPEQRNYYEIIREGWQKLHFDLDLKHEDMEIPTLEYAELTKNYLIKGIVEYFSANVKQALSIEHDIMVFSSHGENRYSYHIIVDNFAFPTSAHCKEVTKKVITSMPNEMKRYIDTSVNKRNQQFRILRNCKERETLCRFKDFVQNWNYFEQTICWKPRIGNDSRWSNPQYLEYLIFERTMVSYFPYQPFLVDFQIPKLTFVSETPDDENVDSPKIDINAVTKLVPNGWHITTVHGCIFNVKANNNETECLLCQRVHEHENQYIYVSPGKQNVFFKCHRAKDEGKPKQTLYLGTLNPEYVLTDEDRLRSAEYEYNKPQIETNDYYNEKFVRDLNPIVGVILLICSFLGTGKTTAFNNYVRRNNPKRVLVLSPRILYTESITSEYNSSKSHLLPFRGKKFKTYLELNENGQRKDYRKCDRLVIQMESLHNLINVEPYDVLILDEIESLLMQYGSSTMREQIMCSQVFERLIRETPIIIGGDAFLSEKSRKTLEQIKRNVHIVRNDYKPPKRTAYMYPSYESLFYRAYQALTSGKKIVFVCASKEKAEEFANGCTARGISFKLYTGLSKNTEIERHELANVNVSWGNGVQCVIYTSRITVGVNFDLPDVFDQLFVYGSSHSCCVRDTFQGTLRVRHIKENVMHAFIYQRAVNKKLPLKEDEVRNYIQDMVISKEMILKHLEPSKLTFIESEPVSNLSKNPIVGEGNTMQEAILNANKPGSKIEKRKEQIKREFIAKTVWTYAPEWLKICLVYNIMECNLSKVCYKTVFHKYLVRCNYKIVEVNPKQDEVDSGIENTEQIKYSDIPDIQPEMLDELKFKIRSGIANLMDHKMVDKYEFNNVIKETVTLNSREELFNKFFAGDKYQKKHFYNRYDEQYSTPETLAIRQLHSKYIETASIRPSRLDLVRKLNTKLGIQNSGQGFNVAEEDFTYVASSLSEHVPDMEKLFNAKSEDKNSMSNLIKRIDKVYRDWSGTSIVRNSYKVQTKGIRQRYYTISKEHDQSVEESVKPPSEKQNSGPIIEILPQQEPIHIDLTSIQHLLKNEVTVVQFPANPSNIRETIMIVPQYG